MKVYVLKYDDGDVTTIGVYSSLEKADDAVIQHDYWDAEKCEEKECYKYGDNVVAKYRIGYDESLLIETFELDSKAGGHSYITRGEEPLLYVIQRYNHGCITKDKLLAFMHKWQTETQSVGIRACQCDECIKNYPDSDGFRIPYPGYMSLI